MKKVNFKNALMALVLALVFLAVGTEQANAQVNAQFNASAPTPGVSYVSTDEAQDILASTIADLKTVLEGLQPGSAMFKATERTVLYYYGIIEQLQLGKSVPVSIQEGRSYLNDSNGNGNLTKQQWSQMVQDATDLLSN